MIKMVNEFKLAAVRFAHPNPMQICGCAWIYHWTKKLWKIRTGPPGRWPAGHRAVAGRGVRAAGQRTCFWQNPSVHGQEPGIQLLSGLCNGIFHSSVYFYYIFNYFFLKNRSTSLNCMSVHLLYD